MENKDAKENQKIRSWPGKSGTSRPFDRHTIFTTFLCMAIVVVAGYLLAACTQGPLIYADCGWR